MLGFIVTGREEVDEIPRAGVVAQTSLLVEELQKDEKLNESSFSRDKHQ